MIKPNSKFRHKLWYWKCWENNIERSNMEMTTSHYQCIRQLCSCFVYYRNQNIRIKTIVFKFWFRAIKHNFNWLPDVFELLVWVIHLLSMVVTGRFSLNSNRLLSIFCYVQCIFLSTLKLETIFRKHFVVVNVDNIVVYCIRIRNSIKVINIISWWGLRLSQFCVI